VLVNWLGVLALTNNFEQVLIGQEVESGEDASLAFKEGTKLFLDGFEATVHIRKCLNEVLLVHNQGAVAVLLLVDSGGLDSEDLVDLLECSVFTTQLFGQIRLSLEDRLQVGPFALDLKE
jgi:hypothetical protein